MAGLQFTPIANAHIEIDVADTGNTCISVPIKHIYSHKRWKVKVLKTNEFIDSLEGQLNILSYDESSEDDKAKLKTEGYVGYLSYAEGIESGAFIVQIHISKKEFKRITNILSNGNNLTDIDIETPSHGEDLYYGTGPDDTKKWNTEINNWVYIESCVFDFEFYNNKH